MSAGRPPGAGKLLLLMMGVVPVIVALAVVAAILLVRSGVGMLLGVGGPFIAAMALILALGLALGRAAMKANASKGPPPDETGDGKDRG